MLNPKRAGLLLGGLILLVLVLEGGLSLLRTRNVTALVSAAGPTAIPTVTPVSSGTPNPDATAEPQVAAALVISTKGNLRVEVTIDYRIGPRFPSTTVRAEVVNSSGNLVSAVEQRFECGTDALRCNGNITLSPVFGTIMQTSGNNATPIMIATALDPTWPIGTYTLRVMRSLGGLDALNVLEQRFLIAE